MSKTVQTVVLSKEFYRDGWRTMVVALPILMLCLVISILATIYAFTRDPEPRYFATENGRLVPLAPLNIPYVTQAFMFSWVAEAIGAAYTLDFQNYRKQAQDSRKFFTFDGFEDYKSSIKASGHLQYILDNRVLSSAVAEPVPVIINEGVVNGVYMWKIRIPLTIGYQTQTQRLNQKYIATLVVVRMPTHENPYGIGISQLIVRQS